MKNGAAFLTTFPKVKTLKLPRGGSRTAATSKVELCVIIVNGWNPLTIITKSSTLDVAAVLDPPLLPLTFSLYEGVYSATKCYKPIALGF